MAEKEITRSELIEPTLEILYESRDKSMRTSEINDKLASKFINVERKDINVEAGWARSYVLHGTGLISNPKRGYWKLSDKYRWDEINIKELKAEDICNPDGGAELVVKRAKEFKITEEEFEDAEEEFDIEKNNNKRIGQLAKSYVDNEVSLFLGAGVSMDAGLPSWEKLIDNFERKLSGEVHNKKDKDFRRNNKSMLSQTRIIKTGFSRTDYIESLEKAIYEEVRKNLDSNISESKLLKSLVEFIYLNDSSNSQKRKCRISEIITFNFDNVLEKKIDMEEKICQPYPTPDPQDMLNKEGIPNIYHVHGILEEGTEDGIDIIFSEEEYHQMYNNPFSWSNIIQINSLYKNTCLFVGCSLDDPNMKRLLDASKIEHEKGEENTTTKHYAILPKDVKLPSEFILENNQRSQDYDELEYTYQFFVKQFKEDEIDLIDKQVNREIERWDNYFKELGIEIIWVNHYSEVPSVIKEIIKMSK